MAEPGQKLLLAFGVVLREVEHEHAGKEVGPEEGLVRDILMRVEEYNFLPVLAPDVVGGDVDEGPGTLAEQPAHRLLFLAHDEVDQEAFSHLLRPQEAHDVEVRVVLVLGKVVDEVFVRLELVCGFV